MTRKIHVEGIGYFTIPSEPEARTVDSEMTVRGICGRHHPELAWRERAWNQRCGQEYSYLNRHHAEDVSVILDIGCNVGSYFVWACRCWWPDSVREVYAYDPCASVVQCARVNAGLVQREVDLRIYNVAVTIQDGPVLFRECVRTGCSHTDGLTTRAVDEPTMGEPVRVKTIHPSLLPAADAIKTDAEGVDADIFEHYRHWDRIKVAAFEWHDHDHRERMFAVLRRAGLVSWKDDCGASEQGVAVWGRP